MIGRIPPNRRTGFSGFGNGVSAFETAKSSRPQGATSLRVTLTGHSISETALNSQPSSIVE